MPNYDVHVLSGIVTYPLAVLISLLLWHYVKLPLHPNTTGMVIGYVLYVLGSDLPDLDHPDALIHRGAKPIVSVAVGSAIFLTAFQRLSIPTPWNVPIAWGVGALGGLLAWFIFDIITPRHRGVVHSLLFAVIYGLLSYILVAFGLRMNGENALYAGFVAFLGYTLHLLLDRSVKLV